MKMERKFELIDKALRSLGVRATKVETDHHERDVGNVYVNGRYFGAFDFSRCTFVE